MLFLKFEVAREASSPSRCASGRAVPWADEAEQQLSILALSACQLLADVIIFLAPFASVLSADVLIFGAGLRKEPGRDTPFPGYF